MKVAIIGAGAIGGYVGAKLALAGDDVTFIVRGANLDAIRKVLLDNSLKSDMVHPNGKGYAQLAAAVQNVLRKAGAI